MVNTLQYTLFNSLIIFFTLTKNFHIASIKIFVKGQMNSDEASFLRLLKQNENGARARCVVGTDVNDKFIKRRRIHFEFLYFSNKFIVQHVF